MPEEDSRRRPALAPPQLAAHLAERPLVDARVSSPERVRQLERVMPEKETARRIGDTPAHRRHIARRLQQQAMLVARHGFRNVGQSGPHALLVASLDG